MCVWEVLTAANLGSGFIYFIYVPIFATVGTLKWLTALFPSPFHQHNMPVKWVRLRVTGYRSPSKLPWQSRDSDLNLLVRYSNYSTKVELSDWS